MRKKRVNIKLIKSVYIILVALIVCGCASHNASPSANLGLKYSLLKDGTLMSPENIKIASVPSLAFDNIGMPEAPQLTLAHKSKDSSDYFFLIEVQKWSRGISTPKGYCGCGVEVFLKWIHVNNSQLIKEEDYLIQSCFYNIHRGFEFFTDSVFGISAKRVANVRDKRGGVWRSMIYTYDMKNPTKGINSYEGQLMLLENSTGKWFPYEIEKK